MKTAKIKWNGKTIKYQTNNTGIVSKKCFKPFEEAGLSKEVLLQMDWHQFSKGIVVSIEGKSVRFSNDFLPEGTEKHRSGSASSVPNTVILEKVKNLMAKHPDVAREIFPEEVAILEAEATKAKAREALLKKGFTEDQIKVLGL